MVEKVKPEVRRYSNAVESVGGAVLTAGHLKRLLTGVPNDTPLVASSDEEGNRFGLVYSVSYDRNGQSFEGLGDFDTFEGLPSEAMMLVIMPAI